MSFSEQKASAILNAKSIFAAARLKKQTGLDEYTAKKLISAFGIDIPEGRLIRDLENLGDDLEGVQPPWAVKIISPDIQHKSDGGYVALSITTPDDVRSVVTEMASRAKAFGSSVDGFLVEQMASKGIEIVIGGFNDKCFGPTIMFGLGGIFVELLKDVSFRICPIIRCDAEDMIDELQGVKVFNGIRGGVTVDREILINVLLAVGGEHGVMMTLRDDVEEIDLNPIIVNGNTAVAVDALISLRQRGNHVD